MATRKATDDTAPITVPAADGDGVMLVGADLIDKTEVEGKSFKILALKNEVSATNQALGLWVEAELADGQVVMFNDFGKGMRDQIDPYLKSIGQEGVLDLWIDLPTPIRCPRGVRISRYFVDNPRTGKKDLPAKTAYFTTSGGRK